MKQTKTNFQLSTCSLVLVLALGPGIAHAATSPETNQLLIAQKDTDELPLSRDALFGDTAESESPTEGKLSVVEKPRAGTSGFKGYLQAELARTIEDPAHWSKMRLRADLSRQGKMGEGVKYRLGARFDLDAAYVGSDYYSDTVKRDQRANAVLRENYIDFGAAGWDFRLGKQNVVWGEMVGLYFADVVSARDLTEFILPDFDAQRIPQWAARAEFFGDVLHGEILWVPVPSYDRIGKPGADFYPQQPVPPGFTTVFLDEVIPDRKLSNTNYGLRLSGLFSGFDLSAFYYRSMDVASVFSRQLSGGTTFVFTPQHERIEQAGGTMSKDLGSIVLKAEFVHTRGRQFTLSPVSTDSDGLAPSSSTDWAGGLDFSLPADARFNVQVFQRLLADHHPDMLVNKRESGYSLMLTAKPVDRLEAQLLWIASLDRTDWLFRPKLTWSFEKNWRGVVGADIFKGPALGLFGQYDSRDRVYSELRYSF